MKLFITLTLIIVSHSILLSQTTVTVIMTGPDKDKITKADMFDQHQKQIITKVYKDTLTYHFTKAPKVEQYWIRYFIGEEMYRQMLWLGDGQITLYAHLGKDELVIDSTLNSSMQMNVDAYYRQLDQTPNDQKNSFRLNQLKRFINTPFSFHIGHDFLIDNSTNKQSLLPLKQVFDLQGDQFADRLDYQNVVGKLETILKLDQILLNNYIFTDRFNKRGKAKIPKAKYYLLDFWHLGCAPCREDHKKIKALSKSFTEKGIEVIGLSIDEDVTEWQDYLRNNEYNWSNYVVPETSTLVNDLSIRSYPSYYLIDKNYNFIGIFGSIEHFEHEFMNKLK